MKTLEKEITKEYKFEELSESAKKHAIEKYREGNLDYDWWQGVYENWTEILNNKGFDNVEMFFSGFSSQGDGACFTATIDLVNYLKAKRKYKQYKPILQNFSASIKLVHQARYYYSTSTNLEFEYSNENDTQDEFRKSMEEILEKKFLDEIEEMILSDREDLGDKLYKDLEEEYEYLDSDEAIKETIENNNYTFDEDGEML